MAPRPIALALAAPLVGVLLAAVAGPWPVIVLLTLVWVVFLLQAFSGRSARVLVTYGRIRHTLLWGARARPHGGRRTIAVPRRSPGATALAWSNDGWARADGDLVGLDLLDRTYDVTAFGTPARAHGHPPVTLELLPAIPHDDGLTLRGLTELLASFDVVRAGSSFDGTTLQALDARAGGGPAVICYEWENVVANYGHVRHPIRERAIREVDHFLASSNTARAVLELDGVEPERITIAPPAVEIPPHSASERAVLRAEGRARWRLEDTDLVLVFMGRGVWEKGLHTLAAAAATLVHSPSPDARRVRWLVAGDGPYLDRVREILGRYNAREAVRFAGQVAGSRRQFAYACADALVLPSLPTDRWLEQFGRVIPEAFAYGLPVVGSDSGAIGEVVGDAGILVAPGDHLGLARAAVALTDPEVLGALADRARARLAAEYTVERCMELTAQAIELALERRRRSAGAPRTATAWSTLRSAPSRTQ
jgi:glycosyltransferase involved in cell wall biosynthesis